jgi:hypothetical protein
VADAPNVKGSALEARFRWTHLHHGPAGMDKLLRSLKPEDRALHEKLILPSSWYPFGAFVRVNEAIDRAFGTGDLSLVPTVARWAAEANLTTLYKFFYQIGSPGFILSMGSRLWRVHYDAGALEVAAGDRVATLSIVDWPEPHRVHCIAVAAWMVRSAELSGATDVVLDEKSCRAKGDARCDFGLTWR